MGDLSVKNSEQHDEQVKFELKLGASQVIYDLNFLSKKSSRFWKISKNSINPLDPTGNYLSNAYLIVFLPSLEAEIFEKQKLGF